MTGLRIAVLGTGSAGMHHLRALRTLDGVVPVAVPLRPERWPELEAAGFKTAASLDDADAQACVVATDTARHAADARAALALGLDVLVEKPLAADAPSARPLVEAAAKTGRRASVACVMRFCAALARFRERLPELGALHSVRVECRSYLPEWRPQRPYRETYSARAEEGGVLRDLVHEIDYAGWVFGWPAALDGRLGNTGRLGIASEEWAELAWELRGGGCLTMGLDYLTRLPRRGVVARGERGTLEWDALAQTTTLTAAGRPPESAHAPQAVAELFQAQAHAFVESLSGAADPRLATLSDGRRALAVCDAARVSSSRSARAEVLPS